MKIYTRTGDQGETGLLGGLRVSKDEMVICAIGDVDEVNSQIGLAISLLGDGDISNVLGQIQSDLFVVGSQLASCRAEEPGKIAIKAVDIERLESAIDTIETDLPKLSAFILPGGGNQGAQLHVCRCICRRAERSVIRLMQQSSTRPVLDLVNVYLNRLSDLLFVLARKANLDAGNEEVKWLP